MQGPAERRAGARALEATRALEVKQEAVSDGKVPRLVGATLALNVALCAGALVVYVSTGSRLVLAQGIDSLNDLFAGAVLTWSARLGARPRDHDHPFGHQPAEPIGALVLAVLTGALAFEVLRSATFALATKDYPALPPTVAAILGAKFASKLLWWRFLARHRKAVQSSALDATVVDTRNDVVACASSLVGYALSRAGWLWADAALALPVAFYVGWNGFALARENVDYLMGASPSEETLSELRRLAAGVPGVLAVGTLRAQYRGRALHVQVEIVVSGAQSVTHGHDIGVAVQQALDAHPLVGETFVHVDPPGGRPHV